MKQTALHGDSLVVGAPPGETSAASASLARYVGGNGGALAAQSDASLVALCRDGDGVAFQVLYDRHVAAVARVCRRWLRRPELVQDAVQETFLRGWKALPTFVGGDRISHWLKRTARNYCLDIVRRQTADTVDLGALEARQLEDTAVAREFQACLYRLDLAAVLDQLDPRDAAMLTARHVDDAPVPLLAERWGLTISSMNVALTRARQRARQLCTAEGLRGLLFLPPLRRQWRTLSSRAPAWQASTPLFNEAAGQFVLALAIAIPHLIGGAAGGALAMTMPPSGGPEPPPVSAATPITADQTTETPVAPPAAPAAPAPTSAAAADSPAPLAQPSAAVPSRHHDAEPAASFNPVPVPGTDRTVTADPPPQQPDQTVGVETQVGDDVWVESYDDPDLQLVQDAACTVAEAAEPLTYCET